VVMKQDEDNKVN